MCQNIWPLCYSGFGSERQCRLGLEHELGDLLARGQRKERFRGY
jgi:hypothetical protein